MPGATKITPKRIKLFRVAGMAREPELRRGDDTPLAMLGQRLGRRIEVALAPGHDVDLTDRLLAAPRHDAIALGDEQHGGAALGGATKAKNGEAFRRGGREAGLADLLGLARRAMTAFLRQRERALIERAARQAGDVGHFADGFFERDAVQRLTQQRVCIVGAGLGRG